MSEEEKEIFDAVVMFLKKHSDILSNLIYKEMRKDKEKRCVNDFVCGIDNGICLKERCTRSFSEKGCMYLEED